MVRNFCSLGSCKCLRVRPTGEVVNWNMRWQDFQDVSGVPTRRTSRWTRSLLRFDKRTLATKWRQMQQQEHIIWRSIIAVRSYILPQATQGGETTRLSFVLIRSWRIYVMVLCWNGWLYIERGRKDDTGTAVTTDNKVEDKRIKAAYVIVNNGYLRWPTTIPPMKDTCNWSELRFSQWLEALKKL